jgi:hypothetical protein
MRACIHIRVMLLLGLLSAASALQARLMFVFTVELAWSATHVILVKETSQPGRFEIAISLKGDLARGSIIDVPNMVSLQPESARVVHAHQDITLKPATLVLFLRDELDPHGEHARWIPASHDMETSMVWVQNSKAYCFLPDAEQIDLQLQDCGMSWGQMGLDVQEITRQQTSFEALSEIPDKRSRAEALASFLVSKYRAVRSAAFQQLEDCGQDSVPTLLALLHDPALIYQQEEAIRLLVKIEGQQAGPDLTALLDSDVQFWTAVGPTLKTRWTMQGVTPEAYLPRRYGRTLDLLRALDNMRFERARKSVTALRDAWRSLSQLAASDGKDAIMEECNKVLSRLPAD